MGDLGSIPGLGRSPGEGNSYPFQYSDLEIPWTIQSMGSQRVGQDRATFTFTFHPGSSDSKESVCTVGDLGSIPGLGRSPGKGKGYPFQYSSLENSRLYSPWDHKESDTTEKLSLSL